MRKQKSINGFGDTTFAQQHDEALFYDGGRHVSLGLLQTDNSINKINTFTRSLTVCHEEKMNAETKSAPSREAGENHIQTFACMRVADGAMNAAGTHRNNRPHS